VQTSYKQIARMLRDQASRWDVDSELITISEYFTMYTALIFHSLRGTYNN
jgi:hypothetical protein